MRALPREGQLLAVDSMPSKAGGHAANVAVGLVKQGFSADVVGCLGGDSSAQLMRSSLEEQGVGCERLVYAEDYSTSKTVILLVEGEDRRYIHTVGANAVFSARHISREWLEDLKVFYLGGLLAMPALVIGELVETFRFCREKGIVTVVDVVIPEHLEETDELLALLPFIDYFLPNDDEAELITGERDLLEQLRVLRANKADTVIITQGSAGAVASQGDQLWQCAAYETQVVDPSGSGDAFASGVITGILHGWDMSRMLCYASALGASSTGAVGATDGVFKAREAEKFMASHPKQIVESSLNR